MNWQKMSAYSAEMLEACRTVTLKVKILPILRCSRVVSSAPSRPGFSGFSTSSDPAARNHKKEKGKKKNKRRLETRLDIHESSFLT